jgi:hypothetical protein
VSIGSKSSIYPTGLYLKQENDFTANIQKERNNAISISSQFMGKIQMINHVLYASNTENVGAYLRPAWFL